MADTSRYQEEPEPEPEEPEKPSKRRRLVRRILFLLFHILFIAYFIWATVVYITYDKTSRRCIDPDPGNLTNKTEEFKPHILCKTNFCLGYGFLLLIFIFFYIACFYYYVFKPTVGAKYTLAPVVDAWMKFSRRMSVSIIMLITVIVLVTIYFFFQSRDDFGKMVGLCAPILFIILGVLLSKHPKAIQWRIVVHGLLGQLILGIFSIRFTLGSLIFDCASQKVVTFLGFTEFGSRFVYGNRICDEYVFAFAILAVIFFFSVVTSIAYYLGVMQSFLGVVGGILQFTVGTTVCESVNAVTNIFLGMTESPLMIRPYIPILTSSELHTICTSGFCTVAGSVLGAYVAFGASPKYLLTASVMAAPGSLAFAKLIYPEVEESMTTAKNIVLEKSTDKSIIEAIGSGAANGLVIVLSIVSNIIAILAIFFFFNSVVEWLFELAGKDKVNFLWLLTKIFFPLVFLMGVPLDDCAKVAAVVAEKTVINEFIAYKSLGEMIKSDAITGRSQAIATFALCGFANPGSIGITIAALSAMAPGRRSDITKVAIRAFIAGNFVSFTSASIAGFLFQAEDLNELGDKMIDYADFLNQKTPEIFSILQQHRAIEEF